MSDTRRGPVGKTSHPEIELGTCKRREAFCEAAILLLLLLLRALSLSSACPPGPRNGAVPRCLASKIERASLFGVQNRAYPDDSRKNVFRWPRKTSFYKQASKAKQATPVTSVYQWCSHRIDHVPDPQIAQYFGEVAPKVIGPRNGAVPGCFEFKIERAIMVREQICAK